MVVTTHARIVMILVSSVIALYVISPCFVNTRVYRKTEGNLLAYLMAAVPGGQLTGLELVSKETEWSGLR